MTKPQKTEVMEPEIMMSTEGDTALKALIQDYFSDNHSFTELMTVLQDPVEDE